MTRNSKGQFMKGTNGTTFNGYGVWFDAKGYACIWHNGKDKKLHIFIWEAVNGPVPQGLRVHHKDQNKGNYNLDNLELVTESDHRRIHAGWIKEDGEWIAKPCTCCGEVLPLDQFYPRKGYTPSAMCKKCWNVKSAERNKTIPDKRREYNQRWYWKKKGGDDPVNDRRLRVLDLFSGI